MKFEETEVFNFKGALRGMRNPMNSWDKSDSFPIIYDGKNANNYGGQIIEYHIGENDMKLAQKLILAGKEHSKFMRQILTSIDITAPLYWWKEFDTYKVGVTANSTSTMHKLATTPIIPDCFECDSITEIYGDATSTMFKEPIISVTCNLLENYRQEYLRTKDNRVWKALIQLLPSSWLQKRTVTMSYANLRDIYFQRRNHKLTEWSVDFISWIKKLPYAKELIMLEVK